MRALVFAYLMACSAYAGYQVRKKELDVKFLRAVNDNWENNLRRNARILVEESDRVKKQLFYENSIEAQRLALLSDEELIVEAQARAVGNS